ncbi:hypothetical protein ACOMHN_047684 [Nucella lapillus]
MCNISEREKAEKKEAGELFRMKRRVRGHRVCGVCGDLALCHNFGAVTCETCKAFFRRNANKQKELPTCSQGGCCIITMVTRRKCFSCRLKKCYAIGMDPGLILNDDELKKRRRKMTKAEEYQQSRSASTSSTSTTSPPDPKATDGPEAWECFAVARGEDTRGQCSQSMPETQKVAQGLNFRHVDRETLPSDSHLYCKLTRHEAALLDYLNSSYKEIFWSVTHPKENAGPIGLKDLPVKMLMVAVDSIFRKFVNFSKRVPEFRQLVEEDQAILLKSRCMNVYCVRLAESFDTDRRLWKTTVGEVGPEEVAHLFREPGVLAQIVSFSECTKHVMETDITTYGLMFALVIFNPLDPSLQNRDFVSKQKDKYMVLLKRYLESRLSFLHADRYLAEIINVLVDVETLGQKLEEFLRISIL